MFMIKYEHERENKKSSRKGKSGMLVYSKIRIGRHIIKLKGNTFKTNKRKYL